MRCACDRTCAWVVNCPACAAVNSASSGIVPHSVYERRDAISQLLSANSDPSVDAVDVSALEMNEGDIRNAFRIAVTAWSKVPLWVSVARFVYRFWNRVTSAVVRGRRNAFWPKVVMNCWTQVALSVVQGSTFALAAGVVSTCDASDAAAVLKPSQARWSTLPRVSGASMLDGWTSRPSRSR